MPPMPHLPIRDVDHFYTCAGTTAPGIPLVFVHGWLLSHHYWQPVIEALQSDHPCVAYDLRGFGQSSQIPAGEGQPYDLAAYGEDLGQLLGALGLERVWLVGHSLGGSIALWGAHLWPERVAGVVCVNAGGGIYLREEFERFRGAGVQIVRWRSPWLDQIPGLAWGLTRMMVRQPLAYGWGQQRLRDLLAAHPEAALGALLESTTEAAVHQLPQVVAGLAQPVYFAAGGCDRVMAEPFVQHLASFHSQFEQGEPLVRVIPQCGHLAMVEHPMALAQCIHHWVTSHCDQPENFALTY